MVLDGIEVARWLRGEALSSLRSQPDTEPQFTPARNGGVSSARSQAPGHPKFLR
jgi:hypothetical protein